MCTLEGAIKTFQGFKVPSNFIFEHRAFEKYKQIDLLKFHLFVDFLTSISLSMWSNYPNSIRKKTTLNYPILVGYFGDLSKFSRILHEHRIFLSLLFFCKRLIIARCKIKWLCSDRILCSWSIRENLAIWGKKTGSPKYLRKKPKHLELCVKEIKHLKTTWTGYMSMYKQSCL